MSTPLRAVSVTEVGSFRDCRRRWFFTTQSHLEPLVPQTNLWFGSGVHVGLEAYYKAPPGSTTADRVVAALDAFDKWYDVEYLKLQQEWGELLWPSAVSQYDELRTLGQQMLANYGEYDDAEGNPWTQNEPRYVEQRMNVDIPDTDVSLTARMDLVATEQYDCLTVIVDHKTASRAPSLDKVLDLDGQLTGYAYVWWRIFDELPYVSYDVLMKRAPEMPKVLKNGTLSQDMSQKTTHTLYRRELVRRGLPTAGNKMLDALASKGWSDFFARMVTQRSREQLQSYEQHLIHTVADMAACVDDPALAYPNPGQQRCPGCPYLNLCLSMEEGGDVTDIIDTMYREAPPRW